MYDIVVPGWYDFVHADDLHHTFKLNNPQPTINQPHFINGGPPFSRLVMIDIIHYFVIRPISNCLLLYYYYTTLITGKLPYKGAPNILCMIYNSDERAITIFIAILVYMIYITIIIIIITINQSIIIYVIQCPYKFVILLFSVLHTLSYRSLGGTMVNLSNNS